MKVLQVIPYFYPFAGGVEANAYHTCKELVKLGHEITVICYNHEKGYKEEKIYEEIEKNRYGLIHTHIPSPFTAFAAAKASSKFKIPLVLTYHNDIGGLGFFSNILSFVWNLTFGNYIMSKCSLIFATTPVYPEISPWLRMHKKKVKILHNGVDLKVYNPSNSKNKKTLMIRKRYDGKKIIFFVGSMGVYKKCKGIDYLIKSAVHLKKSLKDFVMIIGGKGKLREDYIKMAERLKVDDVVNLIGYIKEEDIPFYYASSFMTVLPSINKWEGFGIIIIESLASKKPVIGSNIGGIPFAVGNGGLLANPKDEKDLAEKIKRLINDKKLYNKFAKQGFKRVQNMFQWKDIAKTQERFYREIIRGK